MQAPYWIDPHDDLQKLSAQIYRRVLRQDPLREPGAALFHHQPDSAEAFRRFLLALIAAMSDQYRRRFGKGLRICGLTQFDQQSSTRAHLDGGPARSLLVLGYEPTPVQSRVSIVDYVGYARAQGQGVAAFLDDYNPMYSDPGHSFEGYTTALVPFEAQSYRVLVLNNSSCSDGHQGMWGVMHQAEIAEPLPHESRRVNSIMVEVVSPAEAPIYSPEELQRFVDGRAFP